MGNSARRLNPPPAFTVRKARPDKIQNVLSLALKKFGIDKEIARYQFVLHWPEIVGPDIAKLTRPECFRNGALVVRVANSTWAQELSFQKDAILRRLKKFTDPELEVSDVQFYVGEIR